MAGSSEIAHAKDFTQTGNGHAAILVEVRELDVVESLRVWCAPLVPQPQVPGEAAGFPPVVLKIEGCLFGLGGGAGLDGLGYAIRPTQQHAGNGVSERAGHGIKYTLRGLVVAEEKIPRWRAGLGEIVEEDSLLAADFDVVRT